MKVLIFNHSFFPFSETFVFNQINGLSKQHEVILLSEKFENEDIFVVPNKKIHFRSYVNIVDKALQYLVSKLTNTYNNLAPYAQHKIKVKLSKEKIEVIHAHFGPLALKILPIAKELNIPLIVTFHGIDASEAYLKRPLYKKNLKELFNYAQNIIIVSKHMIDSLELNNHIRKTVWIPCGIDVEVFKPYKNSNTNPATITFLHTGRLVEKKGVPDLIRSFSILSSKYNIHLDIIGDGPERAICEEIISKTPGISIKLWGSQPSQFVIEMLNKADIFVLNSRTASTGDMEGVPNSLLEAMSMELPVISTYHAGIPDVIQNGSNGILVDEFDNQQLSKAMEKMIVDDKLRSNLGKNARITVVNGFSLDITIKKLNQCIQNAT